jgi:hypothetical protein
MGVSHTGSARDFLSRQSLRNRRSAVKDCLTGKVNFPPSASEKGAYERHYVWGQGGDGKNPRRIETGNAPPRHPVGTGRGNRSDNQTGGPA